MTWTRALVAERLRSDPDALAALVARTAEATGVVEAYIEKDFWATEVLRVASRAREALLADGSTAQVEFLFKGGTSLSRVYRLVDRFSEDIDLLAVFPDRVAKNARHTILKQVDAEVSAHLGIAGEVSSSETGVKRYTTYRYPTEHSSGLLKEGVLLELGSRGGTQPAALHPYRSMVADHAIGVLGDAEDEWEEFEPFDVLTLAPERTLLEKLAGLHAMATTGDLARLRLAGRHFYDIHQLLGDEGTRQALVSLGRDGIAALAADIDEHSRAAGFASAPRPDGGYADSPSFSVDGEVAVAIAEGYRAVAGLIYGEVPELDAVRGRIAESRQML